MINDKLDSIGGGLPGSQGARVSPVQEAFGRLDSSVTRLRAAIEALDKRLRCVLADPDPQRESAKNSSPGATLIALIDLSAVRVTESAGELEDMTRRLLV